CGREGSVNGTVTRSASCAHTAPIPNEKITIKVLTICSPDSSISPVPNLDIAVERVKLELRPALADANSVKLIAFVNELSVALLTRRRPRRNRRHVEIGIGAAVECFQPDIRRKSRPETDVDVAVQRSEIARGRRVAAEQHLERPVERVGVAGTRNLDQIHAAIDVLDIER